MSIPVYDFRNPDYLIYNENGGRSSTRTPVARLTQCSHCGGFNQILLDKDDLDKWQDPTKTNLIHEVFFWLDADNREVLKTGIHAKCWLAIFVESD